VPRPLHVPFESVASPFAVHVLVGPLTVLWAASSIVMNLGLAVAVASVVVRFRRARGTERQQLRWVALAAGPSVLMLAVALAGQAVGNDAVVTWAAGGLMAILPLAIGRPSCATGCTTWTASSAAPHVRAADGPAGRGYTLVVLGLGQLLGHRFSLAVAGATLAVAALFQPARRRVQALVDRRCNRRRYDAAQTIAAFSARLRDEIDLTTLTGELLAVVETTIQPTQASL
jgi:hypothetical protein